MSVVEYMLIFREWALGSSTLLKFKDKCVIRHTCALILRMSTGTFCGQTLSPCPDGHGRSLAPKRSL